MYTIEEIFPNEGYDLKDILKDCLYKYYINYNRKKDKQDDLQKSSNDANLDMTIKEVLL